MSLIKPVQLLLHATVWSLITLPAHGEDSVKEVAVPSLPDIATVRFVPGKAPVILYNPQLCRQAGKALCTFYRYHEYGHIALKHNERDDLTVQEKEDEADRWAAMQAPLTSVMAAYRFFSSGHGGTPMHGRSHRRALRMVARIDPDQAFDDILALADELEKSEEGRP